MQWGYAVKLHLDMGGKHVIHWRPTGSDSTNDRATASLDRWGFCVSNRGQGNSYFWHFFAFLLPNLHLKVLFRTHDRMKDSLFECTKRCTELPPFSPTVPVFPYSCKHLAETEIVLLFLCHFQVFSLRSHKHKMKLRFAPFTACFLACHSLQSVYTHLVFFSFLRIVALTHKRPLTLKEQPTRFSALQTCACLQSICFVLFFFAQNFI